MDADNSLLDNKGLPKSLEDLIIYIKTFGWWQRLTVLLSVYINIVLAFINIQIVFYQITPPHACTLPFDTPGWSINQMQMLGSPVLPDLDEDGKTVYDQCLQYDINLNQTKLGKTFNETYDMFMEAQGNLSHLATKECTAWTYDRSDMHETVVTEWDLVCGEKWWVEHGSTVNFAGMLLGSVLAGIVSDKWGRKYALWGSVVIFIGAIGLATSFVPSYLLFMICRFFATAGYIGANLSCFTYTLECMAGRARTILGGLYFIPFAIGYSMVALVAYLVRDWRTLNYFAGIPALLVAFTWIIFPESPRWLLVNGRCADAEAVMKKVSKMNGVEMPPVSFEQLAADLNRSSTTVEKVNFLHVFKYRVMCIRTIFIWIIWVINSMVYYGLSLNVSSFAGDVFVNNALAGAPVEILAYLILTGLLLLGRKPAAISTLFFCGFALIIIYWIPTSLGWLRTLLGLAGKCGITISFTVIYLHTTELYPTTVRTTGLAIASAWCRIGAMLAPYISGLNKLGPGLGWLPLVIFGICSIIGGFLTFMLPETLGRPMPEQMIDAIEMGSKPRVPVEPPGQEMEPMVDVKK